MEVAQAEGFLVNTCAFVRETPYSKSTMCWAGTHTYTHKRAHTQTHTHIHTHAHTHTRTHTHTQKAFMQLDEDKSGTISIDELSKSLKQFGVYDDAAMLLDTADKNGVGGAALAPPAAAAPAHAAAAAAARVLAVLQLHGILRAPAAAPAAAATPHKCLGAVAFGAG